MPFWDGAHGRGRKCLHVHPHLRKVRISIKRRLRSGRPPTPLHHHACLPAHRWGPRNPSAQFVAASPFAFDETLPFLRTEPCPPKIRVATDWRDDAPTHCPRRVSPHDLLWGLWTSSLARGAPGWRARGGEGSFSEGSAVGLFFSTFRLGGFRWSDL